MPAEPRTISELTITGHWASTGGSTPQPFLVDNGIEASERLLIFASPEQLRQLAVADTWFMDETFDVAPRLFRQLYVIRVVVDDTAVSCVYTLLTGKSQTLYEEMLHAVVTKCEELRCSADRLQCI